MNWNRVEGTWRQFMGAAKVRWAEVTEERLERVEGEREQKAGRVQEDQGTEQEAREGRDARSRGEGDKDMR